jgi:hypothetical protein
MAWTEPKTDFNPGDVLNAAEMNDIGANLNALTGARRLGYQTRTTNYTADQTYANIASAADMFSSDITFTADGTSTYWVQFYCGRVLAPAVANAYSGLYLTDGGSTTRGLMAILFNNADVGFQLPCHARVPIIPSAGSFTINIRATATLGSFTWGAGAGGATEFDNFPMWLAVYGPETTNA